MEFISSGKARRGGKKNRKFGRAMRRPSHHRYNNEKRWIKNKIRKLVRHCKKFPNDTVGHLALKRARLSNASN
jgi:hypothetical protein